MSRRDIEGPSSFIEQHSRFYCSVRAGATQPGCMHIIFYAEQELFYIEPRSAIFSLCRVDIDAADGDFACARPSFPFRV